MTSLAATLRRIRLAHAMSQMRLADTAGCDHSFVSRLEAGSRNPSLEQAERLATALDATETERYELLTSAGYHCDIVVERDLLTLNAVLQDDRIDSAYRDSMRNTIRSLVTLAEQERSREDRPRWYAPLREVG